MKKHITKTVSKVLDFVPFFLSIVASIAIVWFIGVEFGMTSHRWYLLLLAGFTGISILIPSVAKLFKPIWFIVGTGISLLLLMMLPNVQYHLTLIPIIDRIAILLVSMIIIELLAYGKDIIHIGGILIDVFIALIAGWLLYTLNTTISTLIIIPVALILSLVIDFDFCFSLKQNRSKETTTSKE